MINAPSGTPDFPIDDRMSFDEALDYVARTHTAAFAAIPVFEGDIGEAASGVRIFLIVDDGSGGWFLHFAAGPFFSGAYAEDEKLPPDQIPDSVRHLRFLPTRYTEDIFDDQIQLAISRLVKASEKIPEQMPDYERVVQKHSAPEVVFPIGQIGRVKSR